MRCKIDISLPGRARDVRARRLLRVGAATAPWRKPMTSMMAGRKAVFMMWAGGFNK
jgi:hypothetical protein